MQVCEALNHSKLAFLVECPTKKTRFSCVGMAAVQL